MKVYFTNNDNNSSDIAVDLGSAFPLPCDSLDYLIGMGRARVGQTTNVPVISGEIMRKCIFAFGVSLCVSALFACQGHDHRVSSTGDDRDSQHLFAVSDDDALRRAEELSRTYLFENAALVAESGLEVWTTRVDIDELSMAHTRFQQTVDNVPVFGGEVIVHLNPNGSLAAVSDSLIGNISVSTTPKLQDYQAVDLAVMAHGGWGSLSRDPAVDLQIVRVDDVDHLTYRVALAYLDTVEATMPVVFIDAVTGDEVMFYDNLQTARNRRIHDAENRYTLPGALRISEGQGEIGDTQENQLYRFTGHAYDYYLTEHGRDSYDNRGATMVATAHYGNRWVNAQWTGSQTRYGDGDGVDSGPLTTDDVVYHEWTHAVTQYTADLIYRNESGALNEATSDIMAAVIEDSVGGDNPWWIGENCWTPGTPNDALRYMDNPTNDNRSTDYYPERYTGSADNGGVHRNSGIANLFFYLLTNGGTHPRGKTTVAVTSIGIDAAADIWYRALSQYMTSSSNFAAARTATVNAAKDLFGASSDQVCQVENAWSAVGVGSACDGSNPPPPQDSCENACGGQSPDGCWCDDLCTRYNDCCPDKVDVCG